MNAQKGGMTARQLKTGDERRTSSRRRRLWRWKRKRKKCERERERKKRPETCANYTSCVLVFGSYLIWRTD